jgi:hypothetical protein
VYLCSLFILRIFEVTHDVFISHISLEIDFESKKSLPEISPNEIIFPFLRRTFIRSYLRAFRRLSEISFSQVNTYRCGASFHVPSLHFNTCTFIASTAFLLKEMSLKNLHIMCWGGEGSRSWEHPSLRGSPACRSKLPCCADITRLAYLPFHCCKLKPQSCNCGEGLSETQSQQLAEPLRFSGLTLVPALSHIIRTTASVLRRF